MDVQQLKQLPEDIHRRCDESRAQGFRFLDRLVADFESGANRFNQNGEALFGVLEGDACVAVGGVNRDPLSTDTGIGRVRRVYVRREHPRPTAC